MGTHSIPDLDVLTAAQVSRQLDVSYPRLKRAIDKGLTPDSKLGKTMLFRKSRLSEIRLKLGLATNPLEAQ